MASNLIPHEAQTPPSQFQVLDFSLLETNDGQLEGLPANPREINEQKFELLKKNIGEHPEFLKYNMLKVFPLPNGHFIIIGGNMRYRALCALGYTAAPCAIIDPNTDVEALKAYVILDNSSFGKWEWSMLANEWEAAQLQEWGVNCDVFGDNGDNWDMLSDVEGDPESPDFGKKGKIVVVVPEGEEETLCEIRGKIIDLISSYAGVEVK